MRDILLVWTCDLVYLKRETSALQFDYWIIVFGILLFLILTGGQEKCECEW